MLLVNKHLLLFSTEEKAYYSALISLCGDRVVLVLVLYLQGSINVFTEGKQGGRDASQAAFPSVIPPSRALLRASGRLQSQILARCRFRRRQDRCSLAGRARRCPPPPEPAARAMERCPPPPACTQTAAAPLFASLRGWACALGVSGGGV